MPEELDRANCIYPLWKNGRGYGHEDIGKLEIKYVRGIEDANCFGVSIGDGCQVLAGEGSWLRVTEQIRTWTPYIIRQVNTSESKPCYLTCWPRQSGRSGTTSRQMEAGRTRQGPEHRTYPGRSRPCSRLRIPILMRCMYLPPSTSS